MCKATPREVLRVEKARVEVLSDGQPLWVSAQELPDLRVGEYVIVYAGQALERIDSDEALRVLQDLTDLDALFDELMQGEHETGEKTGTKIRGT